MLFIFQNVEVSWTLQRICFIEQNVSVKLFTYAKFGYRTVSSFSNTKLETFPDVKVLKLENPHIRVLFAFVMPLPVFFEDLELDVRCFS